jgi:RNA polymerase sigma-70 factor (ECF subfamily)
VVHSGELLSRWGIAEVDSASRRDEKLVAAVRAGSGAAFGELQNLYSARLYRRIFSITRSREDTEDVLQETFLLAFTRIDSFEGRSQFSTWLTRIAINSALMCLRRRRTRPEISLQEQPEVGEEIYSFDFRDTSLNPEQICDLRQRSGIMLAEIEKLDPKSRSVVGIWIKKECSMKEVASTLDVSLATVKARLHRARKKLAKDSGIGQLARRIPSPRCQALSVAPR